MRAWCFVLLAACSPARQPLRPTVGDAPLGSALSAETPAPDDPFVRIAKFAGARGGLHGTPTRIGGRTSELSENPCWLFFVGGDRMALAAWTATRGDFAKGRIPGVSAPVVSEVDGDLVFERVEEWPRAVRVDAVKVETSETEVVVESLPARDQPAGLRASLRVAEARGSGSAMRAAAGALDVGAERVGPPMSEAEAKAAVAKLKAAAASPSALASLLGPAGADVYASWQSVFARKVGHVDATTLGTSVYLLPAEAMLRRVTYCGDGECPALGGGEVRIGKDGKVRSLVIRAEPAPTGGLPAAPGDDEALLRASIHVEGPLRVLAEAQFGPGARVSVLAHDQGVVLLEHDGYYVSVTETPYITHPDSTSARVVDLDHDGVADIALYETWRAAAGEEPFTVHGRSFAYLRGSRLDEPPTRSMMGAEVSMLGAASLDEAVRRAESPPTYAKVTKAEACATLRASATPTGRRRNATSGATLAWFYEPGQPATTARLVPLSASQRDDAMALKKVCTEYGIDFAFYCEGDVCGNLGHALGSFYYFVREGKTPKLALALIYGGS